MPEVLLYKSLPESLRDAIASGAQRTLCPKCLGGTTSEQSLSIRPDAEGVIVKLSCWRSTCDWYAYTVVGEGVTMTTRNVKAATVYCEATMLVSHVLEGRLREVYGLQPAVYEVHGWAQTACKPELVMPIRCPNGGVRGHVTRTFTTPKRCYTYKATAQPWLDWWTGHLERPTVVVEDTLSACRLYGLGYNAVALLGTSITVEQAKEIAAYSEGEVFLALDRDAHAKSINLARRHSHIVQMLPVCLTEDIKNMDSDLDIHKLFTNG